MCSDRLIVGEELRALRAARWTALRLSVAVEALTSAHTYLILVFQGAPQVRHKRYGIAVIWDSQTVTELRTVVLINHMRAQLLPDVESAKHTRRRRGLRLGREGMHGRYALGHGEHLSNQLLPKKIETWAPGQ